jgi:hypothetical protein
MFCYCSFVDSIGGRDDECENASNYVCLPNEPRCSGLARRHRSCALLPGEDGAEFAKFTARFLAAAKPRDFIEEMLARDAIDLSWEFCACAA